MRTITKGKQLNLIVDTRIIISSLIIVGSRRYIKNVSN